MPVRLWEKKSYENESLWKRIYPWNWSSDNENIRNTLALSATSPPTSLSFSQASIFHQSQPRDLWHKNTFFPRRNEIRDESKSAKISYSSQIARDIKSSHFTFETNEHFNKKKEILEVSHGKSWWFLGRCCELYGIRKKLTSLLSCAHNKQKSLTRKFNFISHHCDFLLSFHSNGLEGFLSWSFFAGEIRIFVTVCVCCSCCCCAIT